jgi:hypothetical protein
MKTLHDVLKEFDDIDAPEIMLELYKHGLDEKDVQIESGTLFTLSYPDVFAMTNKTRIYIHTYELGKPYFLNQEEAEQLNVINHQSFNLTAKQKHAIYFTLEMYGNGEWIVLPPKTDDLTSDPYRSFIMDSVSDPYVFAIVYSWGSVINDFEKHPITYLIDLSIRIEQWDKVAVSVPSRQTLTVNAVPVNEHNESHGDVTILEAGDEVLIITTVLNGDYIASWATSLLQTAKNILIVDGKVNPATEVDKKGIYRLVSFDYLVERLRIERIELGDDALSVALMKYPNVENKAIYHVMLADALGGYPVPDNFMLDTDTCFGQF